MQNNFQSLILASTSPRRRELITLFGLAFQFIAADIDETPRANETPADLVQRLSRAKAQAGAHANGNANAIVIGCDTIVAFDSTILGKPRDAAEATRMLAQLRGQPHTVFSGITVAQDARTLTQVATTTVTMRAYRDAEIAAYVATGDPLDKAAAYAIQHATFHPVERLDGCHANVMGLPLCHLYHALGAFGVTLAEPDRACQTHLNIVCPVAREILKQNAEGRKP